ncbi:hypothetical protein NDU88_006823 [Pleurodeles waltl]|uniref:Uncharacterized protein n=1 Tax=Pleurodeles waltl TaxID=8319 RepID=A0AAV7N0B8_PLEWA|nr:hypothetical protein NDU88_006823 [Pleurodeles waltl]
MRKKKIRRGGPQAPGSNEQAEEETGIGLFINGPQSRNTGRVKRRFREGRLQAPGSNKWVEEETGIGLFINGLHSCSTGRTWARAQAKTRPVYARNRSGGAPTFRRVVKRLAIREISKVVNYPF